MVEEAKPVAFVERLEGWLDAGQRGIGLLVLAALFLAVLVPLYQPALRGAFVSDDLGYTIGNPYIQNLTWDHFLQILDPWSDVTEYVANWAPVQLLLHALEWRLFEQEVLGYHVVNLALHALASALLVGFLRTSKLPATLALAGGAIFLVHPANVESVAWIAELKSVAALSLAIGALLCQRERPALALVLFALSLLSKALAVFALPVAVTVLIVRGGSRAEWRWMGAWLVVFALYAIPQWAAFQRIGETDVPLHPDAWVAARTIFAIAARYVAMAFTGYGLSAFHDPPRAESWLDPWWLAGLVLVVVFGARALFSVFRRREEAVYWAWLAAGWFPIAQFFPFTYAMGDRYLYFPLPGLIGLVLLAAAAAYERVPEARRPQLALATLAILAAGITLFAVRVPTRAAIWRNEIMLAADAARNYPDGIQGHMQRAMRAAQIYDLDTVVVSIRAAGDKGFDNFEALGRIPAFQPLVGDPRFQGAVADIATVWVTRVEKREDPTQAELRRMAMAYLARGEIDRAEDALVRAVERRGPFDSWAQSQLDELRAVREREGV